MSNIYRLILLQSISHPPPAHVQMLSNDIAFKLLSNGAAKSFWDAVWFVVQPFLHSMEESIEHRLNIDRTYIEHISKIDRTMEGRREGGMEGKREG